MPRLLILSAEAREYESILQAQNLPGLSILTPAAAQECELVLGEPDRIAPLLPRLGRLRWVQSTWAGVEPLLRAPRRDYTLTNARGVLSGYMVEYVFGYLLAHERRLLQRFQAQKQGIWDDTRTGTLQGKTIGLLGVGSIGARLAQAAKFFGMQVHGFTRASADCPAVDFYQHGGDLAAFVARLDYLVSVLPNTGATASLVNHQVLQALPRHALFINVGRGQVLDESALQHALQAGSIAGAVLDVFQEEPLPPHHPFWNTPNLLLTFHTSAPSFPADIASLFIENYTRYVAGKPLRYQVDFDLGY